MCGLVGVYNPKQNVIANQILEKMCNTMTHRGPDGLGLWRSPEQNCALAHRRLSIIDLSNQASQPMSNKDNTVTIIFNGEIYNHAEIRKKLQATGRYEWKTDHSDTEVLLHAYEEWNLDAFNHFFGMFAVTIFDRRNRDKPVLHLIRDRIGVKPLYVGQTKLGEWVFASEIKAILEHPDISVGMNKTALWHYLTFIVAPAPMTMFENIWKIPAGHGVTIDYEGNAASWEWWTCQPSAANTFDEKSLSFPDAQKELLRLLRESIKRRMVCDVPFGVLLSGGVDSSLNVALMSELMDRPVQTFTVGYEGHESINEFLHARQIAMRYNTNHHEVLISEKEVFNFLPDLIKYQEEPIADNVCIPLYFLSKLVKESHTTVVQVGEGADENLLGYWWCQDYLKKYETIYRDANVPKKGFKNWLRNQFSRSTAIFSPDEEEIRMRAQRGEELFWGGAVCWWGNLRNNLTPSNKCYQQIMICPIKGLLPSEFSELNSHLVVKYYINQLKAPLKEPNIFQKIPYLEHKLRLPEHLLMRVDKMTMAHSIEARVPFLDHELVEFLTRLPLNYKIQNGEGKYILKKVAEQFIDKDLLYRKKQGFGAPMEQWFKSPKFANFAMHLFENSSLMKEGYFNKEYLQNLLKRQIESSCGYSFHLWTVMNLLLWHEYWINKNRIWI